MRGEHTDLLYQLTDNIGPRKLKKMKSYLDHLAESHPLGDRNVNVIFRDSSAIRYRTPNGKFRSVKGAMGYLRNGEFALEFAARLPLRGLMVIAAHEWRHAQQRAGLTEVAEGVSSSEELERDANSVVAEWTEGWI